MKSQKTEWIILGSGACLISFILIVGLNSPNRYVDNSPSPQKFHADCQKKLKEKYPKAVFNHIPPVLPPGNKGYLTFEFSPTPTAHNTYFVCGQDSSGNLMTTDG